MTKDELLEALKYVPGNAKVYVESDHGQQSEMSSTVYYCDEEYGEKLPFYGEDLDFCGRDQVKIKSVKAVLIR